MFYVNFTSLFWLFLQIEQCRSASWNLTIDIMHRQVLDDHLMFFAFKTPSNTTKPLHETYILQYKCLMPYPVPFCPKSWVPLTACSVAKSASCVFYSCSLRADEVLLFNVYELKGSAWSPNGWTNATLSFKVEIPVYPKLENLTAEAVEYNIIKLSWNKVALLSDLRKYKTDNVNMRMKISKMHNNYTESLVRVLQPWATSTLLHGFEANQSYSFLASYHFVIPGLHLPSSTVAGPVSVKTPHKITITSPPINQSCVEISNTTGKYFNISWTAPSSVPPSLQLTINIALKTSTQITLIDVEQAPSTGKFIIVAAVTDLGVSIRICNRAGCSSRVYAVCSLNSEETINESKDHFLLYGGIALGSVCIVLTAIGVIVFCWKKRRKTKQKKNAELSHVGPRLNNQYDEPLSRTHPYDTPCIRITETEIVHSEIASHQSETFVRENNTHYQPKSFSCASDNVSFDTDL